MRAKMVIDSPIVQVAYFKCLGCDVTYEMNQDTNQIKLRQIELFVDQFAEH
jgi:hypothetical protein